VNLAQFTWTMHCICRGWNSNLWHPAYSPFKRWIF